MTMRKMINRFIDLYVDGFKHMTWGKSLWVVVLIKLVIIFAILKIFFFPDFIATHRGKMNSGDFVGKQVLSDSLSKAAPVAYGTE